MSHLIGSDGNLIPDGVQTNITYDGANIDYIDYLCGSGTYRQTYTYTDGKITSVSIPTLQA